MPPQPAYLTIIFNTGSVRNLIRAYEDLRDIVDETSLRDLDLFDEIKAGDKVIGDLASWFLPRHRQDSDCDLNPETLICRICQVDHGAPCPACGGRAFHNTPCAMLDDQDFRWVITLDLICIPGEDQDQTGRGNTTLDESNHLSTEFRLLDDDGGIYYLGKCSEPGFSSNPWPALNWARSYAGCTAMTYRAAGSSERWQML
jgi:hypothetical protein